MAKRVLLAVGLVLLIGCVKKNYAPSPHPALPGYNIAISDKWRFVSRMAIVTSRFKEIAKGAGICDGAYVRKWSDVSPPIIFLKRGAGDGGQLPSVKVFLDRFYIDFMIKNGIPSVTKSINGVEIDKDERSIAVDVSFRHNKGRGLNLLAKEYFRESGTLRVYALVDDSDAAMKKEVREIFSNITVRSDFEYKLEGFLN